MNKNLILCVMITLFPLSIFAQTKTSGLVLQGAYDVALNMNITPIAAQTESYLAGMPFNIEEAFVAYQENSDGRAIATWNVLSNTKFNIYIKAENMVHSTEEDYAPAVPLSYILTFSYNLAYPGLEGFDGSGSFWLRSGSNMGFGTDSTTTDISAERPYENDTSLPTGITSEDSFYKVNLFDSQSFDENFTGFTGSVDGRVFFKFTEEASNALNNAAYDYPAGNYTAIVTFFVEGVQ